MPRDFYGLFHIGEADYLLGAMSASKQSADFLAKVQYSKAECAEYALIYYEITRKHEHGMNRPGFGGEQMREHSVENKKGLPRYCG